MSKAKNVELFENHRYYEMLLNLNYQSEDLFRKQLWIDEMRQWLKDTFENTSINPQTIIDDINRRVRMKRHLAETYQPLSVNSEDVERDWV